MTREKKGPKGGESTVYESGLLRKTVYFYPDEWAAIRRAAYEEEKNYTEIIREAIRAYFRMDE